MVTSDKCPRCNQKETYQHMLWSCVEANKVWKSYNAYLEKINYTQEKIENYEDIYKTHNTSALSIIKLKIIQEMIQIIRPSGWTTEKTEKIAMEMKNLELYNSKINRNMEKTRRKWIKII